MTSHSNFNKPIVVQVELTTKCNARVPCVQGLMIELDGQYLNLYAP